MEANPIGLVGGVVDDIDMAAKRSEEGELEGRGIGRERKLRATRNIFSREWKSKRKHLEISGV